MTEQDIAEQVFRPGNLVFGGDLSYDEMGSFLNEGVKTGRAVGKDRRLTSNQICMSLLSKVRLPTRYEIASHFGPRSEGKGLGNIAVIISREKLLQAFPGKLYAIGDLFQENEPLLGEDKNKWWDFSEENGIRCVYGFPIKYPAGEPSYADEVRYYPDDPLTATIPPEFWDGVVVREYTPVYFERYLAKSLGVLRVPVFSPRCELLISSSINLL